MSKAVNPIIPGFAPDPSVCRAGDWYYLVNSTFSYFPGLPIYRSRDLASWEQIGSILTRESQLPLEGCCHSEGLFAPTIRYNGEKFFCICTNISGGGNFIVTADDPAGEWSEPFWLGEDAPGIDPSLFFDDDGSCWYCGVCDRSEGARYFGDNEVFLRRVDTDTMKLTGERYVLWHGSQDHSIWAEGPHIYKKDGTYYLMIAEGGTSDNHSVCIARCDTLTGEYQGFVNNPILTHRHFGKSYPITSVGHADLVETQDGSWFMVMLACRPKNRYTPTGRETFLARVEWEDGWPVVNPGVGQLTDTVDTPYSGKAKAFPCEDVRFDEDKLPVQLMALRKSPEELGTVDKKKKSFRLPARADSLSGQGYSSYVCLRQRAADYTVEVRVSVPEETADGIYGLAVVQSNTYYAALALRCDGTKQFAELTICEDGQFTTAASVEVKKRSGELRLTVIGGKAAAWFGNTRVANGVDLTMLCPERAGGFVGNTVGIYSFAEAADAEKAEETKLYADFSALRLKNYD